MQGRCFINDRSTTLTGNATVATVTTVLSGAEERFAEERPGWNFIWKEKRPQAGKMS